MKRILPIILLLALLCGCANSEGEPTQSGGSPTTQPTQTVSVSTYVSNSNIEQLTGGAVRQYELEGQQIAWILPIHGGVLVADQGEQTALTVISGTSGTITARKTVPVKLEKDAIWHTAGGVAWYDPTARQVVFLDGQLSEVNRLQLPEGVSGNPAVAPDGTAVFYCVEQTIYAMDSALKTIRPVRTNICQQQTLLGCYMDSKVLFCSLQNDKQEWSTICISGETGQTMPVTGKLEQLFTYADSYFVSHMEGTVKQYIYSTGGNALQRLNIGDTEVMDALALGGVISCATGEETTQLDFYQLSSAKKTHAVTIPVKPVMAVADGVTGGIWLLSQEGDLLYWSMDTTAVEEETVYAGTVYTAEAPDTAGLAQCETRANALGKAHGLTFRIYDRALISNHDYPITVEYQPEAINRALDELEAQLNKFPDKFLYKSVAGQIRICIVRDIGGEITSAYHWYDKDPFIILSVGVDMEQAFLDAFSYVLDIHVLGNSTIFDAWNSLNPQGFIYGAETTIMAYLEGETRAFASRRAMESVVDDRASIFYYAMMADNAEMFQSEIMQAKLLTLCRGIRDAWNLERKPDTYIWEQYLNQSLAYQK